MKETHREFNAG